MADTFKLIFGYDYVFPNFFVPNALWPELFHLNYMYSQHVATRRDQALTTPNMETDYLKIHKSLFNNQKGHWPNSTNHSNILANSYYEKVEVIERSVFDCKKHNEKYIYPIKMSPHIEDFSGYDLDSKLSGEFFWKYISKQVLEDAQNRKCVIFLDYGQENFIDKLTYEKLHNSLRRCNIPADQIVLGFNTFNGKSLYEKWFAPERQRLKVFNFPFVICQSSYTYSKKPVNDILKLKKVQRKHYFLFKVRSPRQHRLFFLAAFTTKNLLHKIDWSCLYPNVFDVATLSWMADKFNTQLDHGKILALHKILPKNLHFEPKSTVESVADWPNEAPISYNQSYIYICSETFTHGEHKSLTEKVFKPIAHFMPFIFIAFPGALKMLHQLGFKTFHPYINESYDSIEDESHRFKAILNEIERLAALPIDEIEKMYWAMYDIYEHNYKILINFNDTEKLNLEMLNFLQSKIENT